MTVKRNLKSERLERCREFVGELTCGLSEFDDEAVADGAAMLLEFVRLEIEIEKAVDN